MSAAISYACGRHARHYINFAISRHASGVAAFCFARNAKHDSAHHSLKSLACSPVSSSCTLKVAAYFSAKSCRSSLREKWNYADSDAVPQLSAPLHGLRRRLDSNHGSEINLHVPKLNILSGFSGDNVRIRCSASLPHSHNVHMRCSA